MSSKAEAKTERLEIPERQRLMAPVPLSLLALLIAAAGFIAGATVQKHSSDNGGAAGGAQLPNIAGLRAAGGLASAGGAGAPTTGTVSSVSGNAIYVTDADGNTIKVIVRPSATVTRSATSNASKIHPGDTVVVQGAKKKNGNVEGQSVSASEQGAGPGAGALSGGPAGTATAGGPSSSSSGNGAVDSLFKSP